MSFSTLFFMGGCNSAYEENMLGDVDFISTFDFESGHQDWIAGVSDFPEDAKIDSTNYFFSFYNSKSPASLPWQGYGVTVTADNPHGDLFYFLKKRVLGLKPMSSYNIKLEFIIYTQLMENRQVGEAEDLFLKVGAHTSEPMVEITEREGLIDYYTLNLDKGATNPDSGEDLKSLGSIKQHTASIAEAITGNTVNVPIVVKSDANGSVWLIMGIDSSITSQLTFGLTAITAYYTEIK